MIKTVSKRIQIVENEGAKAKTMLLPLFPEPFTASDFKLSGCLSMEGGGRHEIIQIKWRALPSPPPSRRVTRV